MKLSKPTTIFILWGDENLSHFLPGDEFLEIETKWTEKFLAGWKIPLKGVKKYKKCF